MSTEKPLIRALERIAAALEERLPPIEDANKIEALQAMLHSAEDNGTRLGKLNEELRSDIRALELKVSIFRSPCEVDYQCRPGRRCRVHSDL